MCIVKMDAKQHMVLQMIKKTNTHVIFTAPGVNLFHSECSMETLIHL